MKILDRYILKSFLATFATVFIILFFIFILQGIWLFIAELAGKDLDVWVVVKFLLFYSPKMIPLVLPLSVLLAGIMTFGSFAENYEFAAMKSSGISLNRAMRSLIFFIIGLSIISFFFANNVIPKAEYRFLNLRKNIITRKPAMAIVEGQFNAIGEDFNIKVEKKGGENGEQLSGVTIHKRGKGEVNATVIRSKTGLLKSNEAENLLQLELFDGYYYEELKSKNRHDREKLPFAKSSFSKQVMNIDLSMLNDNDMEDEKISQTNTMLNINELNYTLDSLQKSYKQEVHNVTENIVQRTSNILSYDLKAARRDYPEQEKLKDTLNKDKNNLLSLMTLEQKKRVVDIAANNIGSYEFTIEAGKNNLNERLKNINNHWLAFNEKFVIAYSCLMMFFIGAPLGAIIRKGGVGLPIVFAVIIFIIFHFVNTFGKKLAQENGIPPFLGSWMSSFILTPLAILLTYRATNDIGMINMDAIMLPIQRTIQKIFKIKSKEE